MVATKNTYIGIIITNILNVNIHVVSRDNINLNSSIY